MVDVAVIRKQLAALKLDDEVRFSCLSPACCEYFCQVALRQFQFLAVAALDIQATFEKECHAICWALATHSPTKIHQICKNDRSKILIPKDMFFINRHPSFPPTRHSGTCRKSNHILETVQMSVPLRVDTWASKCDLPISLLKGESLTSCHVRLRSTLRQLRLA